MEHIRRPSPDNDRREIATEFSKALLKRHPEIIALIAYGSSVRGDYLPNSDIDVLCIVDENARAPSWPERTFRNVRIDMHCRAPQRIVPQEIVSDPYQCSLFREAIILYDADGLTSARLEDVRNLYERGPFKEQHLETIGANVVQNYDCFREAIGTGDRREAIRTFVFALWCFSEYMLVLCDRAPGGLRCLARLKMVHSDSFVEIVGLQSSPVLNAHALERIGSQLIRGIGGGHWYDEQAEKARWMFDHGLGFEAFHIVEILTALRIKDGSLALSAVDIWYELMKWDCRKLHRLGEAFAEILTRYGIGV